MTSHQLLSSRNLSSLILNGIVEFVKIDTWISLSCYRDLSKSYTDFPREGVKKGYFTVRLAVITPLPTVQPRGAVFQVWHFLGL